MRVYGHYVEVQGSIYKFNKRWEELSYFDKVKVGQHITAQLSVKGLGMH